MTLSRTWWIPVVLAAAHAHATGIDPSQYSAMRWRLLGPHRGGRVTAVAGIAGDETTYYMGLPGGGIWKTGDGGTTWAPVFDSARVASVGALAVCPSRPSRIYAGTGEMGDGNGVWRSDDAGVGWRNLGLSDVSVISSILVNPVDPEAILVGGLGSRVQPSEARGLFRSADGGHTWNKVLYRDAQTGVVDLALDPDDAQIVFAALHRSGLGKKLPKTEPDGWIYRSHDFGRTWQEAGTEGLPPQPLGRLGLAVAHGTKGRRIFAIMPEGLFRSDDGGEAWRRTTQDPRVVGGEGFSRVFVDPKDPDRVWVVQTSLYLSKDGGATFAAVKGAPGGDDYRTLWIDPKEPRRMIVGADQGATISLNGGLSWTPWYNQPTGQFYHVSADDQFPYYVYAQQQDSGTVAVPSRSDYGEITYRDWYSVGGFEYGYIAPDPLHPNIVYSTGWYGTVVRFDRVTGQITPAFVPGEKYRTTRAGPLQFSPHDPHVLYLGTQHLLQTTDGGMHWTELSPDLTATPSATEEDESTPHHSLSALAPSPVRAGLIWVGTSEGTVQHTPDGGHTWQKDVLPGGPSKAAVLMVEASHHDPAEAFVVLRPRGGVFDHAACPHARPSVLRTTDYGKTWKEITSGLPPDDLARALREDPVRKGLLYVATDTAVFVSFDDGDSWQSLQLNLPATSVRDLVVHGEDLVAATFGRGLWILDDVEPLRQARANPAAVDFLKPATAFRVHGDNNQETPLPPEVPAAANPLVGAIFNYVLKDNPHGELTLEIRDLSGQVLLRFASRAHLPESIPRNVPDYWFGPPTSLPAEKGHNRFAWDLHLQAPPTLPYSYAGKPLAYVEYTLVDDAIPGRTPYAQPKGPLVTPGRYEAVLTVDSRVYRQPLSIAPDPRLALSKADLELQFRLSSKIARWMTMSSGGHELVAKLRATLRDKKSPASTPLEVLESKLNELDEGTEQAPGFGPINRDLARLLAGLLEGDSRPSATVEEAASSSCRVLNTALAKLRTVRSEIPGRPLPEAGAPPTQDLGCEGTSP